ncbi:MAG: RNA polymerase sigma factor RpoD/SigA [Lentisphaeria bacterium]|nr:RNA polymerase sigma factor RpoD/SigA [Lentisphaeria bacterium]
MIMTEQAKSYMKSIGSYKLLDQQEEIDLANAIKAGDERAVESMIQGNLRLVVSIAMEFSYQRIEFEELISAGNVGLIQAVKKFDPSKGAKFSTYAAWWIKQSIRRSITESNRLIRIPTSSLRKIRKIQRLEQKMTEDLGRTPTDFEMSENSEYSEKVISKLKNSNISSVSLDQPLQDGEEDTIVNMIEDPDQTAPDVQMLFKDMVSKLQEKISILNEREVLILNMRFGLDGAAPATLESISEVVGLTRERVRQIQKRAIEKLRDAILREEDFQFNEKSLYN